MNKPQSNLQESSWAHRIGVALQAIVLGELLFFAILAMLRIGSEAKLFEYVGY